jgi:hypothetical protein
MYIAIALRVNLYAELSIGVEEKNASGIGSIIYGTYFRTQNEKVRYNILNVSVVYCTCTF